MKKTGQKADNVFWAARPAAFMAALPLILLFFADAPAAPLEGACAQLGAPAAAKKLVDYYRAAKEDVRRASREETEKLFDSVRNHMAAGEYQRAAEACSRILELNPRDTDAMFALGRSCLWRKRYAEAASWFRRILGISPGHLDAKLALAKTLYFSGDRKGAASEYESLRAERSSSPYAMLDYAQYLAWSSKLEKAESVYKEILAAGGRETSEASLGLARVYGRQKRYGEAASLLKKTLGAGCADSFEVRLELARTYLAAGRLRDSLKLYSELAAASRGRDERVIAGLKAVESAFLARGAALYDEKKYSDAIGILRYTVAKFPSCSDAYKYLGLSYEASGEYGEAVRRFSQYIKRVPADARIMIRAAGCCVKLGFLRQAAEYYRMASSATKGDPAFDYQVAKLMRDAGMTDEVRLAIGGMLEKEGASPRLRLLRAQINYSLSLMDEFEKDSGAIIEYKDSDEEAAGLFKKLVSFYAETGSSMAAAGNVAGAVEYFRSVLKKTGPEYTILMALARARSRAGDRAGAIENCRAALAVRPGDYDASMFHALNLSWEKRYEEAIDGFKAALAGRPGDSEALGGIARTYFWSARYLPSLRYYGRAYAAAKKSLETVTGYGNAMHIFGYDGRAMEKVREALKMEPDYPYAKTIEKSILDSHKNEIYSFVTRSKDSDRICLDGKGISLETDLDLDTRLSASYKSYEAYMEGSVLKYKTDAANLRLRRKTSPLYKIFGGVTLYGLSDPRGTASADRAGYTFGAGYDNPKRLHMALYFDRSPLFENPSALRNGIAVYGPSFDLRRPIDGGYELYFGAGYHEFSDSNSKKNFAFKVRKIKKYRDVRITAGPVYKRVRFAHKKYVGYYSPERYDSGGLELEVRYAPAGSGFEIGLNDEYGRSRELGRNWKIYHKYELEAFYNLGKDFTLGASYLKTNSGLDSASEDTGGYWYERVNFNLNRAW